VNESIKKIPRKFYGRRSNTDCFQKIVQTVTIHSRNIQNVFRKSHWLIRFRLLGAIRERKILWYRQTWKARVQRRFVLRLKILCAAGQTSIDSFLHRNIFMFFDNPGQAPVLIKFLWFWRKFIITIQDSTLAPLRLFFARAMRLLVLDWGLACNVSV
jgi:hypothetical protein